MFSHSARKRVGLKATKPRLDDLKNLINEMQKEKEMEGTN